MLNERIEKYSEIADIEGLYFVWQNLAAGVTSMETLIYMRSHHSGKLCVNILPAILLLEEMGYVSITNDVITGFSGSPFDEKESFATWFSPIMLDFFLKENIISLDTVTYDSNSDKFVLGRNCIKYKFAPYRNLLLSFHLLSRREDGKFIIENADEVITEVAPNIQTKKTDETLLKELELQREEGQAGEAFVLNYEKERLRNHPLLRKIKQISTVDVSAGYDIVSFNTTESTSLDRFIEVKTYKGKPHFHWSTNEMRIARIRNDHYYLYLVDYNKISNNGYKPFIIKNPIAYLKDNIEWDITPDSYLFEFIG